MKDVSDSEYHEETLNKKPFSQRQFNNLMRDFDLSEERAELIAWRLKERICVSTNVKTSCAATVTLNILGNNGTENCVKLVNEKLNHCKNVACNMSIKIHYLHSHIDNFLHILEDFSEEKISARKKILTRKKMSIPKVLKKMRVSYNSKLLLGTYTWLPKATSCQEIAIMSFFHPKN